MLGSPAPESCTSSDMAAVSVTAFLMYTLECGHHERDLGLTATLFLRGEGALPRRQGLNRNPRTAKGLAFFKARPHLVTQRNISVNVYQTILIKSPIMVVSKV